MAPRKYAIKEVFGPTIQGEGSLTGCVTAFVRFAGCNMWDGRPETRAASRCPFCDTDFFKGTLRTAADVIDDLKLLMPRGLVTLSGGEPLLQLDYDFAKALVDAGYRLAIETNGTKRLSHDLAALVSHVTCSPKVPRDEMALRSCDDLKLLFPHPDARITPEAFADFRARRRYLQPVNRTDAVDQRNLRRTVEKLYDLNRAGEEWALSLQAHKVIGVQ